MQEDNKCVHCGADCGKHPVIWNGMKFCCNGCKTVYQLLNENKLYKYYDIENTPGIKIDSAETGNKYAYLDKEEIQEKVFEFVEGDTAKVKFFMPVIHCASCVWLLENLHTLNKGIKHSRVNFVKKEVTITFNKSELSLRQLVEMLVSIHYVPEISLEDKSEEELQAKADKKLLYKMGVAGFAFANVMTYALPEYFSSITIEKSLTDLFRILSYVLIFPVVFYSASDYFISAFKNLIKRNINIDLPIAIGVLVLFIVTSYEVISGTGSGYSDSLSGLVFFLLLGKSIQSRTYAALSFDRNYKSYFPIAVTRIHNEKEESILLNEIKEGDEILIRNKELIPADSILVKGDALIDYSFVTGESTPVLKNEGDFIYAGGRQTGGIIHIKVDKEVEQSHLTKLWNQNEENEQDTKSLKSITDKVSEYFTLVVISIATLGFSFWAFSGDIPTAIFVLTAVLIVACPCALALSLPFTFGNTMRIFGNAGLYIKNISIIEKLTKINTLVFDKTGTITKPDENNVEYSGNELSEKEQLAVFSLAKQSTHPLSNAVANYFGEINYSEVYKFVEMSGRGTFGTIEGLEVRLGSKSFASEKDNAFAEFEKSEKKASKVYVTINGHEKGIFSLSNKYREGFSELMHSLKGKYDLYLLSGDNDNEKETLSEFFDKAKMKFNQKPQDKKDFIEELQKQGKRVLMTGDGLNDSGALMQSNVALSVADDVYHFSPAGDAVLDASKFKKLPKFLEFTQTSLKIVKASFFISFLYNVVGIAFALTGTLSPVIAAILMPISSVSVVAFATFVTRFTGQKLLKNEV